MGDGAHQPMRSSGSHVEGSAILRLSAMPASMASSSHGPSSIASDTAIMDTSMSTDAGSTE